MDNKDPWAAIISQLINALSQINQNFGTVNSSVQQISDSIGHLIKKIDDLPDEREMRLLLDDITKALKELKEDFSKIDDKEEQIFKIRRDLREILTNIGNLDKLVDIIKEGNAAKNETAIVKEKGNIEIQKERLKTWGLIASGVFVVWKLLIERLF